MKLHHTLALGLLLPLAALGAADLGRLLAQPTVTLYKPYDPSCTEHGLGPVRVCEPDGKGCDEPVVCFGTGCTNDPEDYTDSGVGCTDDCLAPMNEELMNEGATQ